MARGHNIATGRDRLALISQSAWVGPGPGQFQLHLAVTASDQAAETLAVIVYGRLFARSQFQAAVSGDVYGPYYYGPGAGNASVPVDDLVNDPAGGVDVDIPVNAPSGGLSFVTTGVYPVQAFLENNGVRVGQPLTTFIVYVGKDVSTLRRLGNRPRGAAGGQGADRPDGHARAGTGGVGERARGRCRRALPLARPCHHPGRGPHGGVIGRKRRRRQGHGGRTARGVGRR